MTAMPSANRAPHPSSLADVLDLVLDKGIVIDAYVRVALVGIEILTLDARVVIASVDTYLRFAEAVNRLDLQPREQATGLPGLWKTCARVAPGRRPGARWPASGTACVRSARQADAAATRTGTASSRSASRLPRGDRRVAPAGLSAGRAATRRADRCVTSTGWCVP